MTEAEIEAVAQAIAIGRGTRADMWPQLLAAHHDLAATFPGYDIGSSLVSDALRAARAAIAALDKARGDGWRTMDSAPKDGQAFLAAVCGQVRVVAYTKTSHVPFTGFCLADQGEDFELGNPTHWRPLPTPPTTEGE